MYSARMFRFSSYCQCWPKIMTHSNMLKSCILKLRIWTDRYWRGNVHNSLFKQCLSQPATWWHVTSYNTFATSVAYATCPRFVTLVWVRACHAHCTDVPGCDTSLIYSQAYFRPENAEIQTLSLVGHLLSPFFQGLSMACEQFFRLLKKSEILSWKMLCKYPSPREIFGKYTFAVRNTKFALRSVGKNHLSSWLFVAKEP